MSTESSSKQAQPASPRDDRNGPLVIDGISYIPSSVLLTGIPKLSIKDNRAFGVFDPRGEAPRAYSSGSELGLYYNDTRYLSTWEMTLNNASPVALAHEVRFGGNTLVISMTNRDLPTIDGSGRIPRDTFLIRRIISLCDDTCYEIVAIRNFDSVAHTLQIEQWAGTKFDDLFEVRGYQRSRRGRTLHPEETELDGSRLTTLRYEGLDNKTRSTHIHRLYETERIQLTPSLAGHYTQANIPPKGDVFLKTMLSFDNKPDGKLRDRKFRQVSIGEALDLIAQPDKFSPFASSPLRIETDNAIMNRAIQLAMTDIQTLLTVEESKISYPYAGIPWYSAPFGRDGIITAYQMLPWYPKLAHGVLDYAFEVLGSKMDPFTDEQPGKVFHEMRRGEMSNAREVPFIPYYGSADSTPLALILLHEYITWTMDMEKLKEWWPAALRALEWIEKWGDPDGDGFIEYAKQSPTGLINQGWKDSHDSIMHENGILADAPIRLCEVQGYAFRARMGMSALAELLGNHELSTRLRSDALRLRARFYEKFWDNQRNFIYLALDGRSDPCRVLTSNMGHCLWSQILDPEDAVHITQHLMTDSMFSGYGIRTLADTEKLYNPMSYHNGSIWPHDNSLIMEGFRNYGHNAALERLSEAMMGVLESSQDFRLPELFCGFRRRGDEPPVPYEVACKPQAWAAGSVFLMLKSMIGLSMEMDQSHVVFHSPILTSKVGMMEIQGLQGRDWEMDIVLRSAKNGTSLDVARRSGKVRVLTVR